MGLIRAARGAIGGTLADQWKEFFYCEAIPADILVIKGEHRVNPKGSNQKSTENIISSGSIVAVADGQAMAIVEQGKVVEFCAVPGEFIYDASTEPSIFNGGLGEGIKNTFKTIGKRFTFGGTAPKDQRVYYFNLKEITGNKFGTPSPVPFRVVDTNIGLDIDISIRCNGKYSFRLTDPLLFYTNVSGNVAFAYRSTDIEEQLKAELLSALQPAFARISSMGIRYSALPGHTTEIADALNEILTEKWANLRGLSISTFSIKSVSASPEDEQMIKDLQRTAVMRNASMAGATLVSAQADAMRDAANNAGGAMTGFLGMNAAMGVGGANASDFFNQAANQQQQQQPQQQGAGGWACNCGTNNTGRFCANCGTQKPAPAGTWACTCGASNTGKFCSDCGSQNPTSDWTCSCGVNNTGRFCSECGASRG